MAKKLTFNIPEGAVKGYLQWDDENDKPKITFKSKKEEKDTEKNNKLNKLKEFFTGNVKSIYEVEEVEENVDPED